MPSVPDTRDSEHYPACDCSSCDPWAAEAFALAKLASIRDTLNAVLEGLLPPTSMLLLALSASLTWTLTELDRHHRRVVELEGEAA